MPRLFFYDVVVLQRDLTPLPFACLEKIICFLHKKVIFDFDDAIWLNYEKPLQAQLGGKNKIPTILKRVSAVVAGNKNLLDYAERQGTRKTVLIPTVVKMEKAKKRKNKNALLTLGWIGTESTLSELGELSGTLILLLETFPDLKLQIVCNRFDAFQAEHKRIEKITWSLEKEAAFFQHINIGLMPLLETDWNRYKCGAKALLFMAEKIPVVISPVGMNASLIRDGENGFLAQASKEWKEKISHLITDKKLRERLGEMAYKTVSGEYTDKVAVSKWVKLLQE
jgi:glycosyltransferase involved in cell wall biosynthesis